MMICSFLKKKLASSRGAPQENDAKFRFTIYPQGIGQFHDNYQIAKFQTVATLHSSTWCPIHVWKRLMGVHGKNIT